MLDKKIFSCPPTVKNSPEKLRIRRQILHIKLDVVIIAIIGGPCEPNIFVLTNICYMSRKRCSIQIGRIMTTNIKFPFKRKACQVYRVKYGRGRIW